MPISGVQISTDKGRQTTTNGLGEFSIRASVGDILIVESPDFETVRHRIKSDEDIDVLVEFDPNHIPGLAFFGMEEELSGILGRKVDLNTPQCLSRYFRDEVLQEALVKYSKDDTF